MDKYILEISEKQAVMIKVALEEYFRLRMHQTMDFANSLCFEFFDKNHTKEEFNERLEKRDMFEDELKRLLEIVHPPVYNGEWSAKHREQTEEMRCAQDIWQVIRHRLFLDRGGDPNDWCVDARPPLRISGEELPVMRKKE